MYSKMNVNGRGATYQEFVFREDPESAVTRLTGLLQSTAEKIAELNALPVLCTIPPSDLATWNRVRLSQRKTCVLTHEHKYENMQYNLITTLVDINKSIASINISRNMQTPRLADTMMKKKGKGRGYKTRLDGLVDGVHPSDDLREAWAKELMKAINKNRAPKLTRVVRWTVPPSDDSDSGEDPEHRPCKRGKFVVERVF